MFRRAAASGFCTLTLMAVVILTACQAPATKQQASSLPNRLSYVGLDDHVYVLTVDAGEPRRVSAVAGEAPVPAGQRLHSWPTWSPDGSRLAFMRIEAGGGRPARASVHAVAADGGSQSRLMELGSEFPIYMAWSPDSSQVTLLSGSGDVLTLRLLDAAGSGAPREVVSGGPLYFAWSPDAISLLLHVNGDRDQTDRAALLLSRRTAPEQAEPLAAAPTAYRAPSWSPDGQRFASVDRVPGGQAALTVHDVRARSEARLVVLGGDSVFGWSPGSDRLAFGTRAPGRAPLYRGLETVRADGSDRQRVTDEDIIAFYWSPDGRRVAFAALDLEQRALIWHVAEPDGKQRRRLAAFTPSEEQLRMFAFFDQYAQSHGVWSPDGRYIVYSGSAAGALETGGQRMEGGSEDAPPRVFIVPADASGPARALVDGSIAAWPTGFRASP